MASFVRLAIIVVSLGVVLFSTSCEKHPLDQLPEVQREQPDPATVWSESHLPSGSPAEVPHEAR
jgi:hypothetical protein